MVSLVSRVTDMCNTSKTSNCCHSRVNCAGTVVGHNLLFLMHLTPSYIYIQYPGIYKSAAAKQQRLLLKNQTYLFKLILEFTA